jgi:endoglucanase
VPATGDGPSVAVIGHIDEIGLIVHHIDDDGFLWFTGVGGWDPVILVGQRVEIATRDGIVPGVVGKRPIHLLESEDRKKAPDLKHLHIDIGARDGDQARGLVRVGDVAVIAGEPIELPNDRVASRSMDNRIGCFVALEAARLVAEAGGAPGDVYACGVSQEEISFGGSKTTAYSLRPDIAIAVDVTFETKPPGHDEKELGKHHFGSGPVITRGSTLDPVVTEGLIDTAEAEAIPYTLAASARATWTDADAFHISRAGIPTGLVSVPLRYMHSPVELVQLDDVANAAKLIATWVRGLTGDLDFRR